MGNMIALITLAGNSNYGNRLQAYALNRALSAYGTVVDARHEMGVTSLYTLCRRVARDKLASLRASRGEEAVTPDQVRRQRFDAFYEDHFAPDVLLTSYTGLCGRGRAAGVAVLGSDQIWNYHWIPDADVAVLLGGFPNAPRCITYAASLGVDDIDEVHAPIFREHLSGLSAISVREFRAAEAISGLTDKPVEVVLDPTLLLAPGDWRALEPGFVPGGERYVLTYFLGEPSPAQEAIIQEEAARRGCGVRRVLDPRDPATLSAGPREFVELFDRAECVFTDSFHACCFSILFHRPFKVFDRAGMGGALSMNSRMETLFRLFELDADMADGPLPAIDWGRVDSLLEGHRARSLAWLEAALGVPGEAARG